MYFTSEFFQQGLIKNFPNIILVPYSFDAAHCVHDAQIDCCYISQKATFRTGMV